MTPAEELRKLFPTAEDWQIEYALKLVDARRTGKRIQLFIPGMTGRLLIQKMADALQNQLSEEIGRLTPRTGTKQ